MFDICEWEWGVVGCVPDVGPDVFDVVKIHLDFFTQCYMVVV